MLNNPYKPIIDDIHQNISELHHNINRGLFINKADTNDETNERATTLRALQIAIANIERRELSQLQKVFE